MISREQAFEQISAFLANKISLDALDDWSAEASVHIHNSSDEAARKLVYCVRGLVNEYEDDETGDRLKKALAEAVADISSGSELKVA